MVVELDGKTGRKDGIARRNGCKWAEEKYKTRRRQEDKEGEERKVSVWWRKWRRTANES
jgi:hypothetical protein